MKKSLKVILLFLLITTFLLSGCKKIDELCNGDDCFSIDLFIANLEDEVANKCVGYAFAVFAEGDLQGVRSGGFSRTSADLPELKFAPTKRVTVASVSKTITAIGVLQLLEKNSLSITAKIYHQLPSDWSLGSNIKTISYEDLLTHFSGFRTPDKRVGFDYSELESYVSAGIELEDKKDDVYENINFTLFRIIIPYLDGFDPLTDNPGNDIGKATSDAYIDYMMTNVLNPAGIMFADCQAEEIDPTLYYPFPHNGAVG
ncbi:MAG: serine hydrolase, partial [Bacteroidetes bacterium]|nr:serine hydrolase [Bacteroidota bacterium]